MKRALARVCAVGIGACALVVGLVGFSQTSAGRPLLGAVTRMAHGGCPFGYDKPMSPAERERASSHFAASHRGEHPAASRPALGFALDRTTRPEVVARLAKHGIACASDKGVSDLTCNNVPAQALDGSYVQAPARTLWFTFGTKQQLLSIVAVSRDAEAAPVSSAFVAARDTLDRNAGSVSQTHGNADPQALSAGVLHQASAEFRFSDYYALTRITNLGKGFMLTEEYRSLAL